MKGGDLYTETDKHNRTKVTTKGFWDTLFKKSNCHSTVSSEQLRSEVVLVTYHLQCLLSTTIKTVTTVQGDACWFQCRKFGLTSSTTYKAVEELAREIKPDHSLREEFETLLCTIGREAWLLLEEDKDKEPSDDADSEERTTNSPPADDNSFASYLITNIEQQTVRDDFLRDLDNNTLDEETIRDIIGRHKNAKLTAAIGTLRKNLKAWANQPSNLHRKYHWYSVAQLKQRIKQIDTRANTAGSIQHFTMKETAL